MAETKAKHIPERTCVGCRRHFAPSQLTRFVRGSNGWKADNSLRHKLPGRGAYLCSLACVERAEKNRRYPGLASAAREYGLIRSS